VTLAPNTALLVIDVQQGLDDPRWGERNNPGAEQMHRLAPASLHDEFATVPRTGEVLAEAGSPG
jgi:nicotinamidase-related amidase